ncbi:MAG TPA: DinB family protein [Anaerolineales bacterium]|nr:DinB family protein [Anaerolineales bacterium]
MIRALLVDLDDTLLENDVSRFLPAYLGLLTKDLSAFGPPDRVVGAVQRGTEAMLANADPAVTLLEAFFRGFTEVSGGPTAPVAEAIRRFYAESYPSLSRLTRPMVGAGDLLKEAAGRGMTIAVATNPLMTRHAVEQRLEWAGVPPSSFPYAVITTVEQFHFAKPRPAYYAEVLARLGCLPTEAVMIGNDPGEDLGPAASLGARGFLVGPTQHPEWPSGDLLQARTWLQALADHPGEADSRPAALVARLEGQLAGLLGVIQGVDPAGLSRIAAPGALSPLEVICHLRDVDREVNLPRLERILLEDDPFLSAVDTDKWIVERGYLGEDPAAAVAGLVETRKLVIARLRDLNETEWSRTARHALLGPITLAGWIAVVTEHDLRHVGHVRVAD